MSKKSVARFFDTSVSTVTRWVEKGVLPQPIKIGGLERWPVYELMKSAAGAMDKQAGTSQLPTDPDEATELALFHAIRDRKSKRR